MLKNSDDIYLLVFLGMLGTFLLSASIILFFIRYQRKFYRQQAQMKDTEMQYQVQILQSTIQSQEDERRRIGQDLHDEVGGSLANLRLVIRDIARTPSISDLQPLVAHCQSLTDNIINNVRHISHNLSPSGLELFGFADVLAELCDRTAKASGLQIALRNEAEQSCPEPSLNTAIALYRVVQELLTNTLKHANAHNIAITIKQSAQTISITYEDDGKGLDQNLIRNKGIGMFNIESRLSMIHATHSIGHPSANGFYIAIEAPITNE